MRCEQAREALSAARYERMTADEARAHVDACADCRAFQTSVQALERMLSADADEEPRPGFDTRFFGRLAEVKTKRRRWLLAGFGVTALAAGAAALLLLRAPAADPAAGDGELLADLEMVEDLDLLKRLDEVEAYAVLSQLDPAEVDEVVKGRVP